MPQDILRLRNMRFFAYHGLFPEENVLGQHFEVDLDLYGQELSESLEHFIRTERRFETAEALQAQIADDLRQAQLLLEP